MLYLEFFHISDLGKHLQKNQAREAYCHIRTEMAETDGAKIHYISFSARVGDYIAFTAFKFKSQGGLTSHDLERELETRNTSLSHDLEFFDVSVVPGRWTDKVPSGLMDDEEAQTIDP